MSLPALIEVARILDVSASMRRVRFAGPGVADYLSEARIPNIKLFFPDDAVPLPGPSRADHHRIAPEQRARVRTYTVRSYDTGAATLDIDFVRHGEEGLASSWVERARPGDTLGALGGGGRLPAPRPWMMLVADDTGLPAASAILEQLPVGQRGLALLEVGGPEDHQALSVPDGVEVRWLHRGGRPPGESALLLDVALEAPLADPLEDGFVWVSAESRVVREVRRHVRALGLPRENQLIIGYWHRGATETAYAEASSNDRVPDESRVSLPEGSRLRPDSMGRLLAGR